MKAFLVTLICVTGALALPLYTADESPLWTRSGKWEGDIALTPQQEQEMRSGRNGVSSIRYRWADRTIPYKLRDGDFSSSQAAKIRSALEQYNTLTCVTVREATSADKDYVLVTGVNSGCWSYVGRRGGEQPLNLQDNIWGTCLIPGTIVHEFLHAAGFYHQQSSTERDEYVSIQWDNIRPGTESNFDKYGTSTISNFGVEYDYLSVMHYDKKAFSKNGKDTIVPIKDPNTELGNNVGFTEKDILKLNRMYGCE